MFWLIKIQVYGLFEKYDIIILKNIKDMYLNTMGIYSKQLKSVNENNNYVDSYIQFHTNQSPRHPTANQI